VEAPLSRRFDELKILILYIDGGVFGEHTMIGAVGVGGVSLGGGQPARRTGGALYRQPVWRAALATALPGDHNIIESPHAGVRIRTHRVTNWQNGSMARRWMASAFLRTEKDFRRIMGYRELWTSAAILSESQAATRQAVA
jgi:hypothetical protein